MLGGQEVEHATDNVRTLDVTVTPAAWLLVRSY
jgi:hypothetical protein